MNSEWHANWLRTGKIPDGRAAYAVHLGEIVHVCFDTVVLDRQRKNLTIPDPGEAAADGFVTPWEVLAL